MGFQISIPKINDFLKRSRVIFIGYAPEVVFSDFDHVSGKIIATNPPVGHPNGGFGRGILPVSSGRPTTSVTEQSDVRESLQNALNSGLRNIFHIYIY